jgi:hypothetical protein
MVLFVRRCFVLVFGVLVQALSAQLPIPCCDVNSVAVPSSTKKYGVRRTYRRAPMPVAGQTTSSNPATNGTLYVRLDVSSCASDQSTVCRMTYPTSAAANRACSLISGPSRKRCRGSSASSDTVSVRLARRLDQKERRVALLALRRAERKQMLFKLWKRLLARL